MASLRFFKTFLTSPKQVGAFLPSGPALARQITDPIDFAAAKVIVELGPGTGAFTRVLIARKRPETRLIAFEINSEMADYCAEHFPDVELVRGSAETLAEYLAGQGIEQVDAVVSGLPFANFPPEVQAKILDGVAGALKDGGLFLGFTYFHSNLVPTTHRYRERLRRTFDRVERLPVIRNVPPAYVMRCTVRRSAAG